MSLRILCMSAMVALALPAAALAGPNNDGVVTPPAKPVEVDPSSSSTAKGARAYALVNRDGTFTFKKGFKSVRKAAAGVFCLTPSSKLDLNLQKIAPSVGVEWGQSVGNNLSAFYHRIPTRGCNQTEIEVLTFAFAAGGNNDFSDVVSFVITIP